MDSKPSETRNFLTIMNEIKSVLLLGMLGVFTLLSQGEESRFYIKGDLGGNLTSDSQGSVRGDPTFGIFFGTRNIGFKARFEPGERAGVACGYQITDWFAAEGEIGAVVNEVDSRNSFPPSRVGFRDGTFANVPLLFNVKLQYPNHSHWTPYIGAGLGVSAAILDVDTIISSNALTDFQRVHTSGADAVFAYQAFAGLRYRLNERMGLSVEYRYLATDAPEWDLENDRSARSTLSFGRIETHAFSLAFDCHF